MSYSKRVLFGDDPADDAARAAIAVSISRTIDAFPCRIPAKRKNRLSSQPYWDPFWPNSIERAAKELCVECIRVNDQICIRTDEELTRVKERAETVWKQSHADFASRFGKRG